VAPRNGIIETGYTGNVLIDMDFVRAHKLWFDERFGQTGGEDTMFFHAMHQIGGRLAYAVDAIVYEEVEPRRETLRWIAARRFRAGRTYAQLQQLSDVQQFRLTLLLSPLKILYCVSVAAFCAPRPTRAMWWLMRGVFHFGMLSYRLRNKANDKM